MSRTVIAIIVLALVAVGAVLLLQPPTSSSNDDVEAHAIVLHGYQDDGSPMWTIRAQRGALGNVDDALEMVDVTLYGDPATPTQIQSDRLVRTAGGSTLLGSVTIQHGTDLSLKTDSLWWDENNQVLESEETSLAMNDIALQAGGFRHELDQDLTLLSQGIEAQLLQNGIVYTVTSDTADATPERVALHGNVLVDASDGSTYECQRLESDPSGQLLRLVGETAGTWQGNTFSADVVQLDESGVRLQGDVVIDLDQFMMEESSDA